MSTVTHERRGHVIVKLAVKEPIYQEGTDVVVGYKLASPEVATPYESINRAKHVVRTQHHAGTVRVKK